MTARAEEFGQDGQMILTAASAAWAPPHLRRLPQVGILRQVWVHHYYWDATGLLCRRDGPRAAARLAAVRLSLRQRRAPLRETGHRFEHPDHPPHPRRPQYITS
ncbi:hypothetical protein [Streptomyces cavernae]|uniref:hypothetical protein n=1 Tax=Streptomyces cavernae TaxID=2259034 RepID=UPI0013918E57|nr:hypothetical protein [Streptomyces cavernae]